MLDRLLQYDHMTLLAGAVAGAVALIILLRWVGQRVVVPKTRLALVGDGSFDYDIAGTDGHQPVLARIAGRTPSSLGEECIAELLTAVTKAGARSRRSSSMSKAPAWERSRHATFFIFTRRRKGGRRVARRWCCAAMQKICGSDSMSRGLRG